MRTKLIVCCFLFNSIYGIAQELSLNFDAGYGFNIATESIAEGNAVQISALQTELSSVIYSYGKGLNINSEIEYFPQKQVGFGIGVGYLSSSKVQVKNHRSDYTQDVEYTATMLRFSPFVKLKFNLDQLSFYSKLGYLIGVSGEIQRDLLFVTELGDETFSRTIFNKGISHGATAGFGVEYPLTNRISLSGEVRLFIQSFGPKKGEVIIGTENGVDQLPELEPGRIHANYVDNYIHQWNPNGSTDFSKPITELRRFYPFSSVGLNLGIQYKLVKNK